MYNYYDRQHIDHIHEYNGVTTYDDRHRHRYRGYTGRTIPMWGSHVHYYEGNTTVNDRHRHEYRGYTGPAIRVPGGHVHAMEGRTSYVDRHDHRYESGTSYQLQPHQYLMQPYEQQIATESYMDMHREY